MSIGAAKAVMHIVGFYGGRCSGISLVLKKKTKPGSNRFSAQWQLFLSLDLQDVVLIGAAKSLTNTIYCVTYSIIS